MLIVRAQEGQSIRVGDRLLTVVSVVSPGHVDVLVDGEPEVIRVAWDRKLRVFPEVDVTVERSVGMAQVVKFYFQAPRSIVIREVPLEATG